ncbi:hypothetical protein A3F38_02135 [Candidatus Saccharibacteria bacterium RIFCSPHIGHO2_12_FULL_48_21]|nr:MAG: hypothetical protein A3F38_02135 [Candidatus Saccharibacteria bacterium RIFCSPHIGHO2_12_FULL_48_21]
MWLLNIFAAGLIDKGPLPETPATNTELESIFNLIYITIGAIGLFLIVFSGFRYVVAQGDPVKIALAKNTLLYTLIGVVAAGSAAAVVQYVLGAID